MKKLLTPLFIFCLSYGISQSISLSYNGNVLQDTLEITIPSDQENDELVWIDITNNSESAYSLQVRKEIISLAPDAFIGFCLNGQCLSGDTSVRYNMAPGKTLSHSANGDTAFHIQCASTPGVSIARFTFYNTNDRDDKKVLIFKVTQQSPPEGIKQFSASAVSLQAYPNPATEKVTITYNIENQSSPAFVLKNMMGVTVLEEPLYQKSDKMDINVSELPRGLYFYSVTDNGKAVLTKKLIVK